MTATIVNLISKKMPANLHRFNFVKSFGQPVTVGFVQVLLEVVAISINNIAAFVRAGQTSPNISSYYLSLSKAGQRLRADGILMPHLHKALSLVEILQLIRS